VKVVCSSRDSLFLKDETLVHVAGSIDPVFDKESDLHRASIKDLESIEKKIQSREDR